MDVSRPKSESEESLSSPAWELSEYVPERRMLVKTVVESTMILSYPRHGRQFVSGRKQIGAFLFASDPNYPSKGAVCEKVR